MKERSKLRGPKSRNVKPEPEKPEPGSPEWAAQEMRALEGRLAQIRSALAAASPGELVRLVRLELATVRLTLALAKRAADSSACAWNGLDGGFNLSELDTSFDLSELERAALADPQEGD